MVQYRCKMPCAKRKCNGHRSFLMAKQVRRNKTINNSQVNSKLNVLHNNNNNNNNSNNKAITSSRTTKCKARNVLRVVMMWLRFRIQTLRKRLQCKLLSRSSSRQARCVCRHRRS